MRPHHAGLRDARPPAGYRTTAGSQLRHWSAGTAAVRCHPECIIRQQWPPVLLSTYHLGILEVETGASSNAASGLDCGLYVSERTYLSLKTREEGQFLKREEKETRV